MLQTIILWIEKVPATFWGVLAGSFFTLLGVFFSNRAQSRRLDKQLQSDRELKSEERQLALRRDIYLPAAEAVSAGLMLVGRLADINIVQEKLLSDWFEKSPAIAKAHLIAGDSTAEALARFNTELNVILLRLFAIRVPLVGKLRRADYLMEQMKRLIAERERMTELLKEINLSGVQEDRRVAVIEANFQFSQKQIDDGLLEHDRITKQVFEEQMQFSKDCHFAEAELSKLLIPLLAAVRAELKLSFNAEAYQQITRESQAQMAVSLEQFIENAKREIIGDKSKSVG